MPKPTAIILLGPPGAGKGTQAELLAEKMGLYYFETSRIIERAVEQAKKGEFVEVDGEKYFFEKERELWQKGILCSPPFVTCLVKDRVKQLFAEGASIIFAGSPRTLYEGRQLVPFLEELYGRENIKAILVEISAKETIFRNSRRRICALMRHPVLYSEQNSKLTHCPLDGSKLVRREGLDDLQNLETRLKEYKERTLPLLNYFKEQGLEVKRIDGSPAPAEVFSAILKALKVQNPPIGVN